MNIKIECNIKSLEDFNEISKIINSSKLTDGLYQHKGYRIYKHNNNTIVK